MLIRLVCTVVVGRERSLEGNEQRRLGYVERLIRWVKTQASCSFTPPLSGTILPGITRASIIELATRESIAVDELPYSLEAWQADAASGSLRKPLPAAPRRSSRRSARSVIPRASSGSATVAKAP